MHFDPCQPTCKIRGVSNDEPDVTDEILEALGRLRPRPHRHPGWPDPHHDGPRSHADHRQRGPAFEGEGPGRVGPARFRVLDVLVSEGRTLSVGEIGERLGVDQPRASRLVQQLVQMHLAERYPDPEDARRTRIAPTDRGRAFAGGRRGRRRAQVEQALGGFTQAERIEFARLLGRFADSWPEWKPDGTNDPNDPRTYDSPRG